MNDMAGAPFLKERLAVDHVLPDRARLPCPVTPRRVDLVQGGALLLVPAGDEEGDAKRSDTSVGRSVAGRPMGARSTYPDWVASCITVAISDVSTRVGGYSP